MLHPTLKKILELFMVSDDDVSACDHHEKKIDEQKNPFYGRVEKASCFARIKGPCGDEVEYSMKITNKTIEEIKFLSTGCFATHMAAKYVAESVQGKKVLESLFISAGDVIKHTKLPPDHMHCSILVVSTFYRAIAEYLL